MIVAYKFFPSSVDPPVSHNVHYIWPTSESKGVLRRPPPETVLITDSCAELSIVTGHFANPMDAHKAKSSSIVDRVDSVETRLVVSVEVSWFPQLVDNTLHGCMITIHPLAVNESSSNL